MAKCFAAQFRALRSDLSRIKGFLLSGLLPLNLNREAAIVKGCWSVPYQRATFGSSNDPETQDFAVRDKIDW